MDVKCGGSRYRALIPGMDFVNANVNVRFYYFKLLLIFKVLA